MPNNFGPVVSVEWLSSNLGTDGLALVDCRWYLDGRSGRAAYEFGHIPTAVFADIDTDLAAPASLQGGRHPLPDPVDFAAAMSRLGIGDETRVVVYDDVGGVIAGRLWWMLDVLGGRVALLDGGIDAWTYPTTTVVSPRRLAKFTPRSWPASRVITKSQILSAIGSDRVILDARSAQRYAQGSVIDARPGHIPGAVSAPAVDNLVDGRLRSPEDLATHYTDLGVTAFAEPGVACTAGDGALADQRGPEVVAYCGSGVSACLNLLSMRRAGLPDAKLYVGSWSEWGADESLPIETD